MFAGRAEIKDDKSIPDFLQSPKPNGWYHLYVVHGGDDRGEEINKKKSKKKMPKDDVADDMDIDDDVCRIGDDLDIDKGDVGDKVGGHVESLSGHLERGPPLWINPPKPPSIMDKSKEGRPKNFSVSSSSTTPMVPIAIATTTPLATQSSTPMVSIATASSIAPANNVATSFKTTSTPIVSPSKGGRKKSWAYGCNKKRAKGSAPRVISTQASSSSQNQSGKNVVAMYVMKNL